MLSPRLSDPTGLAGAGDLFDRQGRRLYLTAAERQAFLAAAERAERRTRTLCLTLALHRLPDF